MYLIYSYGFTTEEDFIIWKAKRKVVATCLLNTSYKRFLFQDEGNCDSNKTFNKKNNIFYKNPRDPTPIPVFIKSKFRNKENWVHFSVMFTYDRKIGIDFFTKIDTQGRLQSRKLDRDLFCNVVLERFREYDNELRMAGQLQRTLLYDGASIHTGKTYRWLEQRNLPHLKSWSKRTRLDVDPTKRYTTYSGDFNPSEFIIYLTKENALKRVKNIAYPTRQQMVTALRESFNEIPQSVVKRAIKHGWRRRLRECIANEGDFGNVSFN